MEPQPRKYQGRTILAVRHESFEHLGHFATPLREGGAQIDYLDMGQPVPRAGFDPLIVLGGPMSANDPDMAPELALIERALEDGIPILGICLGSQLIAKALGARVYRNAELEIGWFPIHPTPAAAGDPVFRQIPGDPTVFHWHGETFDLPRGAEWLAWSDKCRHQAYRYGSKVYGLQFHPEVDAEMIVDWWTQPVNCADAGTLTEPVHPAAFDQEGLARAILDAWMAL